jgi:hypothetical protein
MTEWPIICFDDKEEPLMKFSLKLFILLCRGLRCLMFNCDLLHWFDGDGEAFRGDVFVISVVFVADDDLGFFESLLSRNSGISIKPRWSSS